MHVCSLVGLHRHQSGYTQICGTREKRTGGLNIHPTRLLNTFYLLNAANTEPEKLPRAICLQLKAGCVIDKTQAPPPPRKEGWAPGVRSKVGEVCTKRGGDSWAGVRKTRCLDKGGKRKAGWREM